MTKISIITPIYADISQKIDWLDEMIQSVLSQSITDWELIIIDDKSPLSLSSIVVKYENEPRIRKTEPGKFFENATNEGPAKTRNTAVALAESECILPLDSDDMLGGPEVLEYMYDTWVMDTKKTIYGNVQIFEPNSTRHLKVVELAAYSFKNAMNLGGTMPVSVMHSKECHYEAGGWNSILEYGREDVEYWISAGKRGFCGQKINVTTLIYRKHPQSRDYNLKFENKNLTAMQNKIKEIHNDIYSGRFPMGCCGKGTAVAPVNDPVVMSAQAQNVGKITELTGFEEKDLVWVAYQGPKKGRFDILARGAVGLPGSYSILGTGHHFQIHIKHNQLFSERQHLGFVMNPLDPRSQPEPEPEIRLEPQQPEIIEVPKPSLSTLIRLDSIGGQTREVEIQEIQSPAIEELIIEPNAEPTISSFINPQMPTEYLLNKQISLSDLGLGKGLITTLDNAGYSVGKLAESTPGQLAKLKGIGKKRGETIINKAKELINNT